MSPSHPGILAASAVVLGFGLSIESRGQESVSYQLAWSETIANSNQPVPSPNGLIEPGEGVRIYLTVTVSPGVGSTVPYSQPAPGGIGKVAGLGSIFFDLIGTNVNGGSWSNFTRNPASNPGGVPGMGNWTIGGFTVESNGNLTAVQAGQFVLPGSTAQMANPVVNIFRGTWTPGNYLPRLASMQSQGAAAAPMQHSSILIETGLDPNGDPMYTGKYIAGQFGNTGTIPIVPVPGVGLVLAVAAGVGAARRRGTRS
ncbi:MAG: hypothetical protein ACKVW3_03550 [Phycisphaerales bacterium]